MNNGINLVQKAVRQQAVVNAAQTKAAVLLDDFDAPFVYDDQTLDVGGLSKINSYKTKAAQVKANVGWVYAANDIIAEGISAVEFVIKKTNGKDVETLTQHPILTLLDSPVDNMHGMQFLNLHTSFLNLSGESYIVPVGESTNMPGLPAALHILPAHDVTYKVNNDTGDELIKFGKDQYLENTVTERQFYRDYRANPGSSVQGKSVVAAAAAAIDTDDKAKRYNQNFFANAARPSIVIESDKQMSPEAYRRYKQQLNEYMVGTENAYKPMLLEGGATAKPFALSQKDMDFLNSRKMSMDEILGMFRISPAMLGMITAANRANMEAAEYAFAKWVILPRVKAFCKFVNKYIIDPIDPTLQLSYVEFVPADIATVNSSRTAAVNTYKTVNEIRKEDGLPDIEGGDQLYVENSKRPLGSDYAPVAPPAAPAAPATDETPTAADSEQELEKRIAKATKIQLAKHILAQRKARAAQKKKTSDSIATRNAKGMARIKHLVPLLDVYEVDFMRTTRSFFERQRTDVLNTLIAAMPAPTKALKTKASKKDVTEALQLLFADQTYNIDLSEQITPHYQKLMAAQLVDTFAQLPGYSAPTTVPGIAEFIKDRAGQIAKDINDETQKQILLSLAEGFEAGESRTELTARLNKIFGDSATIRSERIARTESVKAASQADIFGWGASDIVIAKEWYTPAIDACPYCQSMNRKTISLESNYYNLGDELTVDVINGKGEQKQQTTKFKYEAISAPPIHVNCRCTILPVLKQI